jgi:predicted nucleic acid-binding protein
MVATFQAPGLTDTDILIDALRGLPDAIDFLNTQRSLAGIRISIFSAVELIQGCRNSSELTNLRAFFHSITIISVNEMISETAYQLVETFFLSRGMLIPDALIAATALDSHLTLYTKNVHHFRMIPGLFIVRPY